VNPPPSTRHLPLHTRHPRPLRSGTMVLLLTPPMTTSSTRSNASAAAAAPPALPPLSAPPSRASPAFPCQRHVSIIEAASLEHIRGS